MNVHGSALVAAAFTVSVTGCGGSQVTPDPTIKQEPVEQEPAYVAPVAPRPLSKSEDVQIVTEDGVFLMGTLYASEHRQSSLDAVDGAILLLHDRGSTREEWNALVATLTDRYTVLAIDLRGHGLSNYRDDGSNLEWQAFGPDEWEGLALDVRAAVGFLRDLSPPPTAVSLVGNAMGASAALIYAAEDQEVFSVAALSPALAKGGLRTEPVIRRLAHRPVLLAAAKGSKGAVRAARRLAKLARRAQLKLYDGDGKGLAMGDRLLVDLQEFLGKTPTGVAESDTDESENSD